MIYCIFIFSFYYNNILIKTYNLSINNYIYKVFLPKFIYKEEIKNKNYIYIY